jgi:hypothetical protein
MYLRKFLSTPSEVKASSRMHIILFKRRMRVDKCFKDKLYMWDYLHIICIFTNHQRRISYLLHIIISVVTKVDMKL